MDLAATLEREEVRTLLVDRDRDDLRAARLAGLDTHYGSILAEATRATVPLDGIGHFLAVSSNDETNTLAAALLRPMLDARHVYQLVPVEEAESDRFAFPDHLSARPLFAAGATYSEIDRRWRAGGRVRATTLSHEFGYDDYVEHHGDVLPLLVLSDGKVTPVVADVSGPPAGPGDTIFSIVAGTGV